MDTWSLILLVLVALSASAYPYGLVPRWYPSGGYANQESTIWLLWDLYHVAVAQYPSPQSILARRLGAALAEAYWRYASADNVFYERIVLADPGAPRGDGPRGWRVGYQILPWFSHGLWSGYAERLVEAYPRYGQPVYNPYPGSPAPPYTGMGLERVVAPYAALTGDNRVICEYLVNTSRLLYEAGNETWIPGDPSRPGHTFYSDLSDTVFFIALGAEVYGCPVAEEYAANFTRKVYEVFGSKIPGEYDIVSGETRGFRFHVLYLWVLLYRRYVGLDAALSLAENYDKAMSRGELSAYDAAYAAWMYSVLGMRDRARRFIEYAYGKYVDGLGVVHNDGVGGWYTPCSRTWVAGIMLSAAAAYSAAPGLPPHEILAWGGVDTPWTPFFNGAYHEYTRFDGDEYTVVFGGHGNHTYYIPLPPGLGVAETSGAEVLDTVAGRILVVRAPAPVVITLRAGEIIVVHGEPPQTLPAEAASTAAADAAAVASILLSPVLRLAACPES